MSEKKYLKLRHNTWHFQQRGPKALKALYPDKEIIDQSLGTDSIKEARKRRDIILGEMRQQELTASQLPTPNQRFNEYVATLRAETRHNPDYYDNTAH
ncbi:DUF6538 domain-containing protein [Photobacterium damselae]|uniref:DUF6538 domain-containing protein n=1 Tax=Photobacterium damselae TaxID=38293 RepID=UPI0015A09050|nr:DUF6538 domain-containing protein [Photobacterium damselae]NVO59515.1 hypothetical protein [Photobacterium damselae subsp. damselae]